MTDLEAILSDYLVSERPTLDDVYKWNIPKCPSSKFLRQRAVPFKGGSGSSG